jgi:hypothetical protein
LSGFNPQAEPLPQCRNDAGIGFRKWEGIQLSRLHPTDLLGSQSLGLARQVAAQMNNKAQTLGAIGVIQANQLLLHGHLNRQLLP